MQMDLLDEEKEAQNCFYKIEKKLKKNKKRKKTKMETHIKAFIPEYCTFST